MFDCSTEERIRKDLKSRVFLNRLIALRDEGCSFSEADAPVRFDL